MARFLIADSKSCKTFIEADNAKAAKEKYRLTCYMRGNEFGELRCFDAPHASPYGEMHYSVEYK